MLQNKEQTACRAIHCSLGNMGVLWLDPSKAQRWSQGLQPLIAAPAGLEAVPSSAQVMDGSKADLLQCWECSSDPSRSWKWGHERRPGSRSLFISGC